MKRILAIKMTKYYMLSMKVYRFTWIDRLL